MPDRASDLLAAGFTPDEVGAWATRQRQTLTGAGFSKDEIDDYIGGKPPPVPQSFMDRLRLGDTLTKALKSVAEAPFGVPAGASVAGPQMSGLGDFLSAIGESAASPAEDIKLRLPTMTGAQQAGAALGRIPASLLVEPIRQGAQALQAALNGEPVSAEEMIGAASLALTAEPVMSFRQGVSRVVRTPLGEVKDIPVGGLPKAESFAEAKNAILSPEPAPQAYQQIVKLWGDHGIHPAEVAHDAAHDVTITQDLAAGRLPEAYVPPQPAPEPSPVPGGAPQIQSFAPSELQVDPGRFQFKEGGDSAGVSQRLAGVTQWDPIKAGVGIVWEDGAGNRFIADGHQRLGLASRIAENDPAQDPRLNAWVLREADGISDVEARTIAAAKNIAEGTGTAVDAAKVLRDRPDLLPTLPPRSEVVRQAQGLMNLSDDAFGKVVNEVVPANYGAIVGRLAPDNPAMQSSLIDLLHKIGPDNATQAESIVRQGLEAGLHETTQATLFGDEQVVSSLYGERARVLDRAMKQLRRDKTVFQSIVDNSAIIEDLGNTLAQDANARRAAVDGQAAQILQTLANRKGPLSDSLTAAARSVADGSATPAAASRDFVAAVRRQAESGDLARLANGEQASPVATPGEGGAGPRGIERGARDLNPAEEAQASAVTQETVRPPAVEATAQGDQFVLPGAERSARQAMQAREEAGRGMIRPRSPQAEPGGLFAPQETPQPGLFGRLASDESGTLRLGREEPPRTAAERAMLDRLSIGENDAGRKWTWDRLYTAIVDRLAPVAKADPEAYRLARLYAGVSGKADHWLQHGSFDFDTYRPTGKGLKEILAPVSDDLNGFRSYATALRALELEHQGIRTGMDLSAARDVAVRGDNRYAPIMAELVQYQNRLAQYLRDAGVLSDEGYRAMTARHQLYVPFQRVFGDVMGDVIPDVIRGSGKTLQASDPIHAIVGSERRVIDPLESIVRNTYLSLMMAERNAVGTKLIDTLGKADLPPPQRVDTISVMRNGAKETHQVSAELAAAIKGLDEESANTMLRVLGVPARMLRAGATLTPDFMVRNIVRDFFSAVVNTTKGVFSPIDTARGLASAISKDAAYQDWLKAGGGNSTLVALDRRYLQQNLAKLTEETGLGDRAWNVVRHPIDTLRAISQITEEATRLGEFRAVQKQQLAAGASTKEAAQAAAYASREVTLDFARRGAVTRSMNMITAFWNAQVQGVDRLVRAFKEDPAGVSLKIATGITVPSMLLWWANHDDPRWKEIPDWERDLFWIVMTGTPGNGHIYRIPKPFEVGVMFGSGIERLLDAFVDQKPDAFHDFGKSILGALLPGVIPTFALPFVEQYANRSSFTDRSLVPDSQEKLLPEYQYRPYTTETAKALGQIMGAFPGIRDAKVGDGLGAGVARALSSPILIENYIRAWTGGLGAYALQTADAGLRKAGRVPDPPKPDDTLADVPIVKAFVVRYPSGTAESIQRFYDDYTKNKTYFATYQAKAKEGDVAAMQHIQGMGGMRMFVQLDSIKQAMSTQAQFVRNVYENPQITPAEKRQLIDTAYMRQIEIARSGLDVMRRVDAALAAPR